MTAVALLLVFAAFDDITTDRATTFDVEYSALVPCAAWLVFVTANLFRRHDYALGSVSALALIAGVWAQRAIGPGIVPGIWREHVVITAAYGWFWILSLTLLWQGYRHYSTRHETA